MDGVASAANDVTFGPTSQQSFDGLHASKTAGHVERRLPIVIQLIHSRAQPQAHDLNEETWIDGQCKRRKEMKLYCSLGDQKR